MPSERAGRCAVCDHPMTHTEGFGWLHDDYGPDGRSFDHLATDQDPAVVRVITDYLVNQPEQGDWPWRDHCEGLSGGILSALTSAGYSVTVGPDLPR
jgi:hypothetical protein